MNFYIKILYTASEPILTSPNILTTVQIGYTERES